MSEAQTRYSYAAAAKEAIDIQFPVATTLAWDSFWRLAYQKANLVIQEQANALVARLVVASHRGFVFGLTASATFLGNSLGPFTGGVVAATFGIRWVFVVTAALLLANLVWVWLAVPEPSVVSSVSE